MKMTLLEMVQNILNDMDSDSVNSIDDTEEAIQVALIIKTTYERLITKQDWPFLRTLTALTGLGDTARPTTMLMPENMGKLFWVKYDKQTITYLPPEEFKHLLDSRTEQAGVVDSNGYTLTGNPLFWTTFDDQHIVFDGYDSDVESTLQTSKSVVYATVYPTWTHTDSAIPTLPAKFFPTLLADAKGTAFLALKQQANNKEEAIAKTGRSQMQKEAWRADHGESAYNNKINYGRR